jgi:hypothetical protein
MIMDVLGTQGFPGGSQGLSRDLLIKGFYRALEALKRLLKTS